METRPKNEVIELTEREKKAYDNLAELQAELVELETALQEAEAEYKRSEAESAQLIDDLENTNFTESRKVAERETFAQLLARERESVELLSKAVTALKSSIELMRSLLQENQGGNKYTQ